METNNNAGEGRPAATCSALFDLLMEQIDAARKRSDKFEKQCLEENDLVEACKHARVSNVLWHIYHYGLHIAAHPPGCKICEFEEGWGKPFCEACGKIFLPNDLGMAREALPSPSCSRLHESPTDTQ